MKTADSQQKEAITSLPINTYTVASGVRNVLDTKEGQSKSTIVAVAVGKSMLGLSRDVSRFRAVVATTNRDKSRRFRIECVGP